MAERIPIGYIKGDPGPQGEQGLQGESFDPADLIRIAVLERITDSIAERLVSAEDNITRIDNDIEMLGGKVDINTSNISALQAEATDVDNRSRNNAISIAELQDTIGVLNDILHLRLVGI